MQSTTKSNMSYFNKKMLTCKDYVLVHNIWHSGLVSKRYCTGVFIDKLDKNIFVLYFIRQLTINSLKVPIRK